MKARSRNLSNGISITSLIFATDPLSAIASLSAKKTASSIPPHSFRYSIYLGTDVTIERRIRRATTRSSKKLLGFLFYNQLRHEVKYGFFPKYTRSWIVEE